MKRRDEQGFILVGVLVLVMLISMIAMSLMFRVRADETANAATAASDQGFATAMTGIQEAMRIVKDAKAGFTDWEDSPRDFRDRLVSEDGSDRWYFTIWSPAGKETAGEVRYGLTDEARKINVNTIGFRDLSKLPNMTPQMAAALKDFTDFDDITTVDGAEQDYYNGLPQPYVIRNGPVPTIDALLSVRGFTPEALYGEDANMNWRLDPNENDGVERAPADNSDGELDIGLRRYLTALSMEPDVDHDGVPRTNINDPLDPLPGVEFPVAMTNFIAELRRAKLTVAQAADLLEATIKVKDEKGLERDVSSGVGKAELPQALDLFSTTRDARINGLLNVNTASIEALMTIPGIDEPLAEAILSARKSVSPENRSTIAWLYQEDVVDGAKFKQLAPYLTARSFQFSFQVVGFAVPSGKFRRLEVVIDSSESAPRVVYLRDLTRLGMPFKLEPANAEAPKQARRTEENNRLNRG